METAAQFSESIEGVLERIVFLNEENAFCIAELKMAESKEKVTISGPLPGVQCGETLRLNGNWTRHPRHGDQFKVKSFESKLPSSVHGIRKYLGSGLVHGIGKAYAKKIVDHFGARTLEIISKESGRLSEVPGIGKQRVQSIKKAWEAQVAVRDVMMFLQTYGVTTSQCVRLVKKYGNNARYILEKEPYRLAGEIERIGFATADKIALNLGFPTNSSERIDAGILHTMRDLEGKGHTVATHDALIQLSAELLKVDGNLILPRIGKLTEQVKLERIQVEDTENGGILGPGVQLPATGRNEAIIAKTISGLDAADSALPPIKIDAAIDWAQKRAGFRFAGQQALAVRNALEAKVSILTGGPGTGKTTILRALVEILKAKKVRVQLASPTGRAAQRLAEAASAPASTIHRLLKHDPATRGFVHGEDNPLPCDFLILDEASMLDAALAARLFCAVPARAHLLLVGDADQLPSVGAGSVLGDLIQAPPAKVTRLETIFRQNEESGIVSTAHAILKGDIHAYGMAESAEGLDPRNDFNFIAVTDPERCVEMALHLAAEYIPRHFGKHAIRDVQILAPMHRGTAGISALNRALQERLNPIQAEVSGKAKAYQPSRQVYFREKTGRALPTSIDFGSAQYRLGDKVLQMRNNYDKGVFNGDMGIVSGIAPDRSGLTVQFDLQAVEFTKGELSELQHAFAISIHKSQGSEYPCVIIPLLKQHFLLLQRNLIYTAITRAREKVFLVGDPEAYAMAVRNAKTEVRRTHLRTRLRRACERQAADERPPANPR